MLVVSTSLQSRANRIRVPRDSLKKNMAAAKPVLSQTSDAPSVTPSVVPAPRTRIRRVWAKLQRRKLLVAMVFLSSYELISGFAAYGQGAILPLYMIKEIGITPDDTKSLLHGLSIISYFAPLPGAIITDSIIGRFKAMARFKILTLIGGIIFLASTIRPLGLPPLLFYLIAYAIGIVSGMFAGPVSSAFVGDQFEGEDELRRRYYSFEYVAFNVEALVALFLFPALRGQVGGCFGSQFCYPLAFGFGFTLFLVATACLFCGRPFYRIVPPSGVVVLKNVTICIWVAIKQRFRDRTKREHWLDRADVRFSPEFIADIKTIFSQIVLFMPLIVYYALYTQMGTSWTVQSDLLDGRIWGYEILPDSMDAFNTIVVIILLPFFELVLFPCLDKLDLFNKPLQRIVTGGYFVALSFIMCAVLNMHIEKEYPFKPSDGHSDLMFINALDCKIDVHVQSEVYSVSPFESHKINEIPISAHTFTVVPKLPCATTSEETFTINLQSATAYSVVFDLKSDANITMTYATQRRKRDQIANNQMRFIYLGQPPFNDTFLLAKSEFGDDSLNFTKGFSPYMSVVKFTKYDLCWGYNSFQGNKSKPFCYGDKNIASINMYKGAIVETLVIYSTVTQTATLKMMFTYPEDHIPILYQVPQYIAITIGEILLEVTSLTFNYEEAPAALKSLLTALWLCSSSLGNLLIVTVIRIKMALGVEKESIAFFAFAAVMVVDMLFFSYVSYRYKYKPKEATAET